MPLDAPVRNAVFWDVFERVIACSWKCKSIVA
jgi:hypothetical protein